MDKSDNHLTKIIRCTFIQNDLDISNAYISVLYGIVYMTGKISRLPKTTVNNVEERTLQVVNLLKQMKGIKDVIAQCSYQEEYF